MPGQTYRLFFGKIKHFNVFERACQLNLTLNILMKSRLKLTSLLAIIAFGISSFCIAQNKNFVVALDAGHGDHDYGAIYHGHIEKKIALAVVLKVGKKLEAVRGIDVVYTRKTDTFIDLVERANIANRADANIFVSIHCNANKNIAPSGCETYVMGANKNASNLAVAKSENAVITLEKDYKEKYQGFDPNSPNSMINLTMMQEEYNDNSISLASLIQDKLVGNIAGKKNRGVKQAPFMVLHKAYMPRVLIEMGFISNIEEGAFLDSEDGQEQTAQAIAEAIIAYKKEYFGSGEVSNEDKPSRKVVEAPVVEQPVVKTEPKPTVVNPPAPVKVETPPVSGVTFKVQLAAVSRQLELVPQNFKGLKDLSVSNSGALYKYMYGSTSDYESAKKLLQDARDHGFETAYIVAFRDGNSVNVKDVLK